MKFIGLMRMLFLRSRDKHTGYKTLYWKWRNHDTIQSYWNERNHPSNKYLRDVLANISFDSLLEIGCSCGNKLFNVAQVNKNAKIVGIDINYNAVSKGNLWLNQEGILNVDLQRGNIENLSEFKDKSYDVVLSWATLIYVRPNKILGVLKDLIRIASRKIILFEMHKDGCNRGLWCHPGNWKRDYYKLFKEIGIQEESIRIEFLGKNIWDPGGGDASFLEIKL